MPAAVAPANGLLSPTIKQTATMQLTPAKTPKANKAAPATPSTTTTSKLAPPTPSRSASTRPTTSASASSSGLLPPPPLNTDESSASPVFKTARAKKLFAAFDLDRDHYLSLSEFNSGLSSLLSSLTLSSLPLNISPTHLTTADGTDRISLTPLQLDALWKETDVDYDGRISLPEFLYRFAGGLDPRASIVKKPTLSLQTLKRVVKDTTKISVDDLRAVLDAVYDGPNPRFAAVDLTKIEQISNAILKRILTQVLQAEKEEAKTHKRAVDDWAAHCINLGGVTQKDADRLFAAIDSKKTGRIDLGPIFALAAQKPGRAKGKKKSKPNPDYLFTTVKEEHFVAFLNDILFNHFTQQQKQLQAAGEPHHPYRCHPPLAQWGTEDILRKGLTLKPLPTATTASSAQSSAAITAPTSTTAAAAAKAGDGGSGNGYRTLLLLSERTVVRSVVKRNDGFEVYVSCRCELTELKRNEYLWHAVIHFNGQEIYETVKMALRKSWRDGELEENRRTSEELVGWDKYGGGAEKDDIELSIPPIA